MEQPTQSTDVAPRRFGLSRVWWIVLAAITGWQVWSTLVLFGAGADWALTDARPIICGRHALHLYHGRLGSIGLGDGKTTTVDPAYYAGYPRTPWFDNGSRPFELPMALAGNEHHVAAYKITVAVYWSLAPLLVALGARGLGLNSAGACLAALFTVLVCWSDFGRDFLFSGDLDVAVGSALSLIVLGLALAFHQRPAWHIGISLGLAWSFLCYVQPLVCLCVLPLLVLYYVVTCRHHGPLWHVALLLALGSAALANWFWVRDALAYWWIWTGPGEATPTGWTAQWSALKSTVHLERPAQFGFGAVLAASGVIGVISLVAGGQRAAGYLLGAAALVFSVFGLFGAAVPLLSSFELSRFLFTGLLFLAVAAGQSLVAGFDWMSRRMGTSLRGAAVCWAILLLLGVLFHQPLSVFGRRCFRTEALPVGLPPAVEATFARLRETTTPDARILWEEVAEDAAWSPLLAWLTDRQYVGGLGREAAIEHAAIRLSKGVLAGRPLQDWSDSELDHYCRRYNIGWVVLRSSAARERFARWSLAGPGEELPFGGRVHRLDRPHTYVLAGQARVLHCDSRALTLGDLVPADGQVVLSFHYDPDIRSSVDRVIIEKEPQLHDGIPLLRLRLTGPVSRLTLEWGGS